MVEVLDGRDLEAADLDTLRVHAAHDVPDGAVLAGRVHRLEHHEDAVGVLCRESGLILGEQLDTLGQEGLRFRLGLASVARRVEVSWQPHAPSRLDPELLDEVGDAIRVECSHGPPPGSRSRTPCGAIRGTRRTPVRLTIAHRPTLSPCRPAQSRRAPWPGTSRPTQRTTEPPPDHGPCGGSASGR